MVPTDQKYQNTKPNNGKEKPKHSMEKICRREKKP